MNAYAPQHSRIFKEVCNILPFNVFYTSRVAYVAFPSIQMILVSTPNKPFTYTAKNTARRQAILADYDAEIVSLYDAVQKTTQPHIRAPASWTHESALEFVRVVVCEVLKRSVGVDEDIFESGCDRYV